MIDRDYGNIPTYEEVYKEIYDADAAYEIREREKFNVQSLITENKRYSELIRHRLELFQSGITLDGGRMNGLTASKMINADDYAVQAASIRLHESMKRQQLRGHGIDLSLMSPESSMNEKELITLEDYILRYGIASESSLLTRSKIKRKDWALEDGEFMNYSDEFYNWINSINGSFSKQAYFHKFELYKQQAYNWLNSSQPMPFDKDERLAYISLERQKSLTNSLYGLMKYFGLKNANLQNRGDKIRRSFKPHPVQEVLLYLFDLYLSFIVGKPRQIGCTTVMGAACCQRVVLSKGFLFKFTAENLVKAQQIFFSKIRPFLDQYPFKPSMISDETNGKFIFGYRAGKGDLRGSLSEIWVESPYDTIISSGTPDLVVVDEIGDVTNLSTIMEDGRPTMYIFNPDTQRLEVTNQFIGMGTGGNIKNQFKDEWKVLKESWMDRDYSKIVIPVFLDAYCKPGFNLNVYESEKKYYYGKNSEASKIEFHQTFPLSEADMFLSSGETIIPKEDIIGNINRIKFSSGEHRIIQKYGYFEPIFDTSRNYDAQSDIPHPIVGSKFVPTTPLDPRVTSVMYAEPEDGWVNRYFQGSDPIWANTGHSKCASAIWDAHDPKCRIACIVNFRTSPKEDIRYNFLQPLLMGMYYDKPTMRNLVEINAAAGMIGYYREKGFNRYLVMKNKIPKIFQSGGSDIGIRKDSNNARFMAGKLLEMIDMYGEGVQCDEFWHQLQTYTKFEYKANSSSSTMNTYFAYKVENPKFDYDDVIDAVLYSYICWLSYDYLEPKKRETEDGKRRKVLKQVRNANGEIELVDVNSTGYRRFNRNM